MSITNNTDSLVSAVLHNTLTYYIHIHTTYVGAKKIQASKNS